MKPNLIVIFEIINSELADIFPPYRRDRDNHGGGKMIFIREGLSTKRLENLGTKLSETICLELTVSNKK